MREVIDAGIERWAVSPAQTREGSAGGCTLHQMDGSVNNATLPAAIRRAPKPLFTPPKNPGALLLGGQIWYLLAFLFQGRDGVRWQGE